MRSMPMLAVVTLLVAPAAVTGHAQHSPSANPAPQTTPAPVTVPQGSGAPVITDGMFTPGEWDDALRIGVNDGVTLLIKEWRGVVFVGVRGEGGHGIGPSELSLAVPNGPIEKLHVSFALGQVVLPATGAEPKMRLGFTTDWYANELRRDEDEVARLMKEGQKSPLEVMKATSYPSEGIEFAIRRSKFPGQVWLMRLWASAFVAGKPGMVTYPSAAVERTTDGWLELRFK
jgi:hypothetical protein